MFNIFQRRTHSNGSAHCHRFARGWLLPVHVCLCIHLASALEFHPSLSQYLHASWTQNEGETLPAIQALAQAGDGYIWLGTRSGLLHFDGTRFLPLEPAQRDRLPSPDVRGLLASSRGGLWVATDAGICRVDRGVVIRFPEADSLVRELTFGMLEDDDGALWTLHLSHSIPEIGRLAPDGTFHLYGSGDGLPPHRFYAIHRDRSSRFWIGTDRGLCRWQPGSPAICISSPATPITQILESPAGDLLAVTGINIFRYRDGRLEPFSASLQNTKHLNGTMHADGQGNLWIGTLGQGLFLWRDGRLDQFTRRNGLSSDIATAILEDREGNIWAGTANGIDRFRAPEVRRISTAEGLSSSAVTSVAATPDGATWVGTLRGGLNRLAGDIVDRLPAVSGAGASSVFALFPDALGRVWVGSSGGLSYFAGGKFHRQHGPDGEEIKGAFTITGDPGGTVWLADAKARLFTIRNGVASAISIPGQEGIIYRLRATRDGALWAGFLHGGVTRLEQGKAVQYGQRDGLAGGSVQTLYEGEDGALWVGTASGLSRYRNGRWATWTPRNGLPDNIYEIMEDRRGGLWLMTGAGLYRVNRDELDGAGSIPRSAVHRIDRNEGLRLSGKPGMCGPYLARAADGRLWISTLEGVAVLDPAHLRDNRTPPPVFVEQILVDGDSADLRAPGGVNFRGRQVQIAYTGLGYSAPEGVRFRYRLEPIDRAWIDGGSRRNVAYVNLPPARYRFRVIACNADGVWNEEGAAADFRIVPYFYQTRWFYGACIILAACLIWGVHRLRVQSIVSRLQLIAKERSRVTRDLHDSLLQGFSGAVYQLEAASRQIEKDPHAGKRRLQKAIEQADNALHEARRALTDLRIPELETKTLPEALAAAGAKLTAHSAIDFHLTVHGSTFPLDYEAQAALYLIGREAVTNAVNHARPRRIQVNLSYSGKAVALTVQDDGIGFDPGIAAQKADHWGLAGMQERVRLLDGDFQLESARQQGTRITVHLQ